MRRRLTTEEIAEIRRLRDNGLLNREIAAQLGIPTSTVTKWTSAKSEERCPVRRPRMTEAQIAEIKRLRAEGRSHKAIAKMLDIGYTTVRRHVVNKFQLTVDQIAEIRRLHLAGRMQKDIAEMFNVSPATIAKYTTKTDAVMPEVSATKIMCAIEKGFADGAIANAFQCDIRCVAALRQISEERERERQSVERWLQQELRSSARGLHVIAKDIPLSQLKKNQ